MKSVGLKEEDVLDRTKWKNDIQNFSATPDDGGKPGEKKKIMVIVLPEHISRRRHQPARRICNRPPSNSPSSSAAVLCKPNVHIFNIMPAWFIRQAHSVTYYGDKR